MDSNIRHYPKTTCIKPVLSYLMDKFGDKKIIGAEIGCGDGYLTEALLNNLNGLNLYCIYPYESYQDGKVARSKSVVEGMYKQFKQRILETELSNRICFLNMASKKALDELNVDLDFVYIDGNHSYDYVKQDIEGYYKKLKIGGILSGDDYRDRFRGVVQAVNEFSDSNKKSFITLPYYYTTGKVKQGCLEDMEWLIIK